MPGTRLFGPTPGTGSAGSPAINTSGTPAVLLPAVQTVTVNTETVVVNPQLTTVPLLVQIPPNSLLEQIPFTLLCSGYLDMGTQSNVTFKLYSGTSATVGSDTLLKASSAFTSVGTGKVGFFIKAKLMYDSVSGKLIGVVEFYCNGVLQAAATLGSFPTGISNSSNPVVSFLLSVTFATAGTQVVHIQDFAVYDVP